MHEPLLRVVWTDPITKVRGYCVVDRLVGGIATGGTRMRPGVDLEEVEGLARTMSLKTGVFGLPGGGAKGAIDLDPHDPRAPAVLQRFVLGMRPLLMDCWVTAEDLGVSQAVLDEAFAEAGMGMSLHAALERSSDPEATYRRVAEAFIADVDGIVLPDAIGGFGVAEATVAALEHLGSDPVGARASVQGFGSIGGSAARYLDRHGVRVVAVADVQGTVADPGGLDVEQLLAHRDRFGEMDRDRLPDGARELGRAAWREVDCEVLVPAAVPGAIDVDHLDRITAGLVVEGANLPTTPEAERALLDRGVTVVPDFVANAGAVAWAWWTLFGDVGADPWQAFERLSWEMSSVVAEVLASSEAGGGTPREVAARISQQRLDQFDLQYAEGPVG